MDISPNLKLPYLSAAQAQKHVTVNDGLRALDALVQLAVLSRAGGAPPASPNDGDRYIVASGATGAWAGNSGNVAAWQDGAWSFFTPQKGWISWIADEAVTVVFNGSAWSLVAPVATGAPTWGVNATADTTNRLAVGAPASLFNNVGNGHQLKINKASPADTGSVLLQTGFSGRAEMGLTGDDNYHVKVSADGSTWHEAMLVNSGTGQVTFPNTPATSYTLPPATPTTLGGVKAGANLTVAADGTLSAPAPVTSLPYGAITGTPSIPAAQVSADWNASSGVAQILNKPAIPTAYTLPPATATTLGGVKVGANLAVAADGTLSAPTGTATRDVLLQSTVLGPASPTNVGATTGNNNQPWIVNTPAPYASFIVSASIASSAAGLANIEVYSISGTTATIVSITTVTLPSAGVTTFNNLAIPLAAGQYAGVRLSSGVLVIAGTEAMYYGPVSTATVGGTFSLTSYSAYVAQFNLTIQGTVSGGLTVAQGNIATANASIAALQTQVAPLATATLGVASPVASGSVWAGNEAITINAPPTQAGYLTGLNIAVSAAITAWLYVSTKNGDGTFTRTTASPVPVQLAAGVNTITGLNIPIAAGQYPTLWLPSALVYYAAGSGTNTYYSTGLDGSNVTKTAWTAVVQVGFVFEALVKGAADLFAAANTNLLPMLSSTRMGVASVAASTGWAANLVIVPTIPVPYPGYATEFDVYGTNAGTLTVYALTKQADGGYTQTASMSAAVGAGAASVPAKLPLLAGQYVGYSHSGIPHVATASGPYPLVYFNGTVPTTDTQPSASLPISLPQFGYTLEGAVLGGVDTLLSRVTALEGGSNPWNGLKWAALGTSITAGALWVTPVAAALGLNVTNLGVGGATFTNWSSYTGQVFGSISSMPTDAALVTIEGPINDIWNNAPLGTWTDTTNATFCGALNVAIQAIAARAPNALIVLLCDHGSPPAQTTRTPFSANSNGNYQWQFIDAMKMAARIFGIPVFDWGEEAGLGYLNGATYTDGVIHPNALGGQMIANYLIPKFKQRVPLLSQFL